METTLGNSKGFCKDKVHAIPNGKPNWTIPPDYLRDKRESFLLLVGSIEPRKNILGFLSALRLLYESTGILPPVKITGPTGWKNHSIFSILQKPPYNDMVTFCGFVSDEELKRLYLTCKAVIYPSLYEGFGLPVLEALSMDCLLLTSAGTVMEEIAEKAAVYFDPQDPTDIARQIASVWENKIDCAAILQHRQLVLARYDWALTAKKLMQLFTSVVEKT
jgi:alpha-1,3-rhamnosyl/mannosyltransferase